MRKLPSVADSAGTERMLELVMGLPGQLRSGALSARNEPVGRPAEFDTVVVAGMGGSGIGARIVQGLFWDKARVPVLACNDYDIPAAVGPRSLFIAVSYSGATEETLSAFRQARVRGCRIVAVTSGGELGRLAQHYGYPVKAVPGGMPPRAALGYLFSAVLVTLEQLGVVPSQKRGLAEAVSLMQARAKAWHARARAMAEHISGCLPLVYSTSRLLDPVADRWRCQVNENAGQLCHTSSFPEHNHNEIVGMGRPEFLGRRNVVVALLDRETHARTRFRLESVLDICGASYQLAMKVESEGRGRLARVFSLVMLGDLLSVELARRACKDAMEIKRIDELKRRMLARKG
jgi:glucose/mannose-6-phosphate isomerase